jgi:hypothetical protein
MPRFTTRPQVQKPTAFECRCTPVRLQLLLSNIAVRADADRIIIHVIPNRH